MKKVLFRLYITLCLLAQWMVVPTAISAQTASPPRKASKPGPKMAAWDELLGDTVGLQKQDFGTMGLSKLTQTEYSTLLQWVATSQNLAAEKAKFTQLTSFRCGRPFGKEVADYQKVRIYLDFAKTTPSELSSGIRQRLRAMPDVETVYTEIDSDLIVNIVGFELKDTAGNPIGFNVSLVTFDPCEWKIGSHAERIAAFRSHYLQSSGRNSQEVVDGIVTTLDSNDIEEKRAQNAATRKFLNKEP
jgi:hypothetical protein